MRLKTAVKIYVGVNLVYGVIHIGKDIISTLRTKHYSNGIEMLDKYK